DGLGPGDDSVVVGFPANGPYTISPTRVRETVSARGLDIYDSNSVVREVYSVRGIVREGNSGGPLLDSTGAVVGMAFARSATDSETGYALTRAEIADELEAGANSSTAQPTGQCTNSGSPRPASAQGLHEIKPSEHGTEVARPAHEDLVGGAVECTGQDVYQQGT